MKKVVSFLIAIIMVIGVFTSVNATKSSELAGEIYTLLKPYGMTNSNRVRINRYLADNPVTEKQADQIIAKVKEAIKVMDKAGAKKYSDLSDSEKDEIKSIASEAADILGLTLKFSTGSVSIYKNGKLIEVARYDGDKLLYTGNNNSILVVSSVVVIALATAFAFRKKFANA